MTTDDVNTETVVTGSTRGGGLIGLLVLLHLTADLVGGTLPALLALLGHRFALSTTTLAVLVAVSTLTSSLAQPALGGLADRFGARRVAVIGIALDVTLMALVPLAPNAPVVFALVAVGGLGSAALHPTINALARTADPDRPAVAVSLVSAGGTVGVALAPIAVLSLLSVGGAAAAATMMLPGLAVAVLLARRGPPAARAQRPIPSSRPSLRLPHFGQVPARVWLLVIAATMTMLVELTVLNGLPILLQTRSAPTTGTVVGISLTLFELCAAAGGMAAAAAVQRLPANRLVATGLLVAFIPLLALTLIQPGTLGYYVAVAAAGLLVHAGLPVMTIRAQDVMPTAVARASGLTIGAATGIAGILYIGVGHLQDTLGVAHAMQGTFTVVLPGAVLSLIALHTKPRATSPTPLVVLSGCTCAAANSENILAPR